MPFPAEPPRIPLARTPTPLEPLDALGRELGVRLWIKRDDMTGTVLSGNKIRKLEFVLAEALEQRADVVITCGGAQSNHCRTTAAAARRCGLEVELFLRGAREAAVDGNLFLDLLFGATVHALTPAQYARRDAIMAARAEELGALGRRVCIIPEGASTPLGALGYVRCAGEIARQAEESGLSIDAIVSAVGSGGTLAGLIAGAEVHGLDARLIGIPVCDDAAHFRVVVDEILEGLRRAWLPGLAARVPDSCLIDGHAGTGYGLATPSELEQIRDLAVLTGIVLEPVYTNKAFSGLLHLVRSGALRPGSTVVFLHTGGIFGLFPFRDRMPQLMVP